MCILTSSLPQSDVDVSFQNWLSALSSKVTEKVVIIDDIGCNTHISTIVKNLQCKELELKNTNLNQGNTKYLVEAMQTVRTVLLVDVTLEIEKLCEYKGKGRCSEITVG